MFISSGVLIVLVLFVNWCWRITKKTDETAERYGNQWLECKQKMEQLEFDLQIERDRRLLAQRDAEDWQSQYEDLARRVGIK